MNRVIRLLSIGFFVLGWLPLMVHAEVAPLSENSELLQRSVKYQRVLAKAATQSFSQRKLMAISLAVAETPDVNPIEIQQAYLIASFQADDVLTRTTSYNWITDMWVPTSRTTNDHDGQGHRTQSLDENYVVDTWVNSTLETYSYDGDVLSMIVYQEWNGAEWVNTDKSLFTYDGIRISVAVYQEWDGANWVNSGRATYTYDGNSVESTTYESWNGTGWDPNSRTLFTYDGEGRQTEILTQFWVEGAWENSTRSTYVVESGSGYLVQTLIESWEDGAWMNSAKYEYEHDGSGNTSVSEFFFWSDPDWIQFSIDSSSYDGEKVTERIHTTLFPFPGRTRTQYIYDGNNKTEEIRQTWQEGTLAASAWVNSTRITYEFEAGGTAVQISDEPAPAGWELNQNYPNPFNPTTSIRYSLQRTSQVEVTVYNMLGQTVKVLESGVQAPGIYETTWDGKDTNGKEAASGMYLYRISTQDFTETRKMMLLK